MSVGMDGAAAGGGAGAMGGTGSAEGEGSIMTKAEIMAAGLENVDLPPLTEEQIADSGWESVEEYLEAGGSLQRQEKAKGKDKTAVQQIRDTTSTSEDEDDTVTQKFDHFSSKGQTALFGKGKPLTFQQLQQMNANQVHTALKQMQHLAMQLNMKFDVPIEELFAQLNETLGPGFLTEETGEEHPIENQVDFPELENPLFHENGEFIDLAEVLNKNPETGKWFKTSFLMAFMEAMQTVTKLVSKIKAANSELIVKLAQARHDSARMEEQLSVAAAKLERNMAIMEMVGQIVSGASQLAAGMMSIGGANRFTKSQMNKAQKKADAKMQDYNASSGVNIEKGSKWTGPSGRQYSRSDMAKLKQQGADGTLQRNVNRNSPGEPGSAQEANYNRHRNEMLTNNMRAFQAFGSAGQSFGGAIGSAGKVLWIVQKTQLEALAKIAGVMVQAFGELKSSIAQEESQWDQLVDQIIQIFDKAAETKTQAEHFG